MLKIALEPTEGEPRQPDQAYEGLLTAGGAYSGVEFFFGALFFFWCPFFFCGWLVSARTVPLLQALAGKNYNFC